MAQHTTGAHTVTPQGTHTATWRTMSSIPGSTSMTFTEPSGAVAIQSMNTASFTLLTEAGSLLQDETCAHTRVGARPYPSSTPNARTNT